MKHSFVIVCFLSLNANIVSAQPILTSWFTKYSTELVRVIETNGASAKTTWPSAGVVNNNTGGAAQALPVYSDVQRIRYTTTNVYINAKGLASHTLGPWLSQNGGLFGFWPINQNYQIRITRSPTNAVNKTKHPGGMIGMMVNGVAIYDLGDAFAYVQSTGKDAMGTTATNWWWRDALAVEVVTFDPGFAHQPGINGQYHYHAEPKALRYQLGDNMTATYNPTKNTYTYTENTNSLHHSPILGWAYDGFPIYGPYGYSNPTNPASAVTRMRSGFVLRNATNHTLYGTTDIDATGRTTLPKWAAIAQGYTNANSANPFPLTALQYGPATTLVNTSTGPSGTTTNFYTLGRYIGDNDYLGDLGQTQGVAFDLDQYNGRTCVTPDFPGGTYAYFVSLDASGNPAFPYMLGKEYYGVPNAGNVTTANIPVDVTEYFNGGPNSQEALKAISPNFTNASVTLTWSSIEGGTYVLQASADMSTNSWAEVATLAAATNAIQTSVVEVAAMVNHLNRFYRVNRTNLAPYDP